jgi:hypothetical protein
MSSLQHTAVKKRQPPRTFVLTLFTFWPPGPLDRAKLKSTSSGGGE